MSIWSTRSKQLVMYCTYNQHVWYFVRFGNIWTILKTWKTTRKECYKLYKRYQIAKSVSCSSFSVIYTLYLLIPAKLPHSASASQSTTKDINLHPWRIKRGFAWSITIFPRFTALLLISSWFWSSVIENPFRTLTE